MVTFFPFLQEAMKCSEKGHHPFSVWSIVTISISHFLLVLNSATNILVYCLLSSRFREECTKILKSWKPYYMICCQINRSQEIIPLEVMEA